jgi:CMP-N,N'-diacetyllegionaminic acid synthase
MATREELEMVAVIPARGGSKGIPGKNIRLLNGRPLLAYTIEAALEADVARHVLVSTDSDEIAAVALEYGAEVIRRPEEISHDTASTESALLHAVDFVVKTRGWSPGHILTLPPTSPLRSASTIKEAVGHYRSVMAEFDALLTLTENRGDFWRRDLQGNFSRLFPDAPRRRQEREPLFLENSAVYITRTSSLVETGSILGRKCTGFVIPDIEATDINEPIDLKWAEFLLEAKGHS